MTLKKISLMLLLLNCILPGIEGANEKSNNVSFDSNVIDPRFLKGARWEIEHKVPIPVSIALEILDLSQISTTNGDFRLDFNLKQTWLASQIVLPLNLFWKNDSINASVTVDGDVLRDLWTPDAFIPNSRNAEIETLTGEQKTISIFRNQTISFTANMFSINGCAMDFQWYPMETHYCHLLLESYSFTTRNVMFQWDNTTVGKPVTVPEHFKSRQYILTLPLKLGSREVHRFGRKDKYSRLTVAFILQRQLGHFILQTFMPTTFIVSLSWFSFWLGMDAIPGRVSLLVTCMLTLVTLYTGQKVDLPPVSYVKMMDVWMTSCLAFVFAAMFEFIIVRYLAKNEIKKDSKSKGKESFQPPYFNEFYHKKNKKDRTIHDDLRLFESRLARAPIGAWNSGMYDDYYPPQLIQSKNPNSDTVMRRPIDRTVRFAASAHDQEAHSEDKLEDGTRKLWQRIDRAARAAFPLLFLCFCLIFWPVLMYGDPKGATTESEEGTGRHHHA